MKHYRYIGILLLTIIISLIAWPLMAAEKPGTKANTGTQTQQEQPVVYLKSIIVIAIDGWQEKSLQDGTMPRLFGLSQEGIRGKVLDFDPGKDSSKQVDTLVGDLPDLYRNSQRLSMLVDNHDKQGSVKNNYNYIFALDASERSDPDKIFKSVIDNVSKLTPYFTYVSIAVPKGSESDKTKFFRELDRGVGSLLAMLHEKGNYNNTMLVITGRTPQAGTQSAETLKESPPTYPMILKGPNLLTGTVVPTVRLTDIQRTMYYLSDGREPDPPGYILWNCIKSENLYVSQTLLKRRIKELSAERDGYINSVWKSEKERERFNAQSHQLALDRKGINDKLEAKELQVNHLHQRIRYYQLAGLIGLILLISGYFVQYVFLRKKFLLF